MRAGEQSCIRGLLLAVFLLAGVPLHADMVAQYRFDAQQWNGTPGEVVDSSGNGFAGVARNTVPTAGLLCNAADLTSGSTADYLDLDHRALDGLRDFTLMLWYQSTNRDRSLLVSAANAGEEKEVYWLTRRGDRFEPQLFDDSDGRIDIDDIDDGAWHHLAWTRIGSRNCFYVDGQQQDCNQLPGGALDVDPTGFIVGQEQDDIGYDFRNNRGVEGLIDEFYVFDEGLSAAAIQSIRNNNLLGNNWDGIARRCAQVEPRAAYYFDEPSWSGIADEVLDSSGNGFDGVAVNTTTTPGLLCRAADLSATDTSDYLSLDFQALNGVRDFSIGFWARTPSAANKAFLSGARAGQANEVIFWFGSATRFRPHIENNNRDVVVPNVWDNTWHHWMWVRSGAANCIYLDGTLRRCVNLITNRIDLDPGGLIIGQEQDSVGGSFVAAQSVRGEMDELLIFDQALTAAQVSDIVTNNRAGLSWDGSARSCPVVGANTLQVIHDGSGIYCSSELIGVRAINASGDVVTGYATSVTLDTGSGNGSWALTTGNGTLLDSSPDDGLATYTFDPADNGEAWFALSYPTGAPVLDIEAFETADPNVRDSDAEGALVFSPTGFTVTANPLPNPPVSPVSDPFLRQTAGTDFDIHLTAFGTTDDDPVCGVIEDYQGVQSVQMWQELVDPLSGSVRTLVNTIPVGANSAAPVPQNVLFNAGQAVVSAKYKDVGRLRLGFQSGSLAGSTDSFVSPPADLSIRRVESAAGVLNPGSDTLAGAGFVAAGESFQITVAARDAESDPTPNYGYELASEGIRVSAVDLLLPVGGRLGSADDGVLSNDDSFVPAASPGYYLNNTIAFDEVGSISLQAEVSDGSYMGTGNVVSSLVGPVGRFYPHHFELVNAAVDTQCTGFTYMSAPSVSLTAELYARNQSGLTVANYDALLFSDALAPVSFVAEYQDNGIDLGSRFDHVAVQWQSGRYNVLDPAAQFQRLGVADGPYEMMAVGIAVNDTTDTRPLTGLDMNAQTSGFCALGATCTAQRIGTLDAFYGRMVVLPGQGPEDQDLDIRLQAQVFSDEAFTAFPRDNCSTYQNSQLSLSNFGGDLQAGETAVLGLPNAISLVAGQVDPNNRIWLSAPGTGNTGTVDVELQIPAWLRYNWSGAGDENPRAQVTFGQYRGHDRIIIWQQDP
ncbi:MAG: LamG domain-containing protein [Pseudomonadaceae bacterium]|nr:LamG domain-containing protein [Pseudomonadaceae bacterium]